MDIYTLPNVKQIASGKQLHSTGGYIQYPVINYNGKDYKKGMYTALFTIARTWNQPKCPSTDEWIKKMWHIYTKKRN